MKKLITLLFIFISITGYNQELLKLLSKKKAQTNYAHKDSVITLNAIVDYDSYLYSKSDVDSKIYTPYTGGIVEIKPRIANQNQTYAGTIRMVGSEQTYTTLTAAYTAATNGDIIQLVDGTYDLAAESGGHWLVNTSTKGVLVRGNLSNPGAVILTCSSGSYGIRLRDCAAMTFESLTFVGTGAAACVHQDQAYNSRWVKFKNCIFNKTTTSTWLFARTSLTSDTNTIWIEFDGCTINSSVAFNPIQYLSSGVNETILITNCTFNKTDNIGTYQVFPYLSTHNGTCAIYDSYFYAVNTPTIVQFGHDEEIPTNTTFKVDIRNTTIAYTSTNVGHGLLLGRGTNKVYCVNNNVSIPASTNNLAIGIIVKTTATSVNDSYIAGNYIVAPRPFYIKGGQNNIIKYNTCIATQNSTYAGFHVNNPEASRLSTGNVVKFNNFYGDVSAIRADVSSGYEHAYTTIQGYDMNYNLYFSYSGVWAIQGSSNVSFANRRLFFNGANDGYSIYTTSYSMNVNPVKIFDATSIISW